MKYILTGLVAANFLISAPAHAQQQPFCVPHDDMLTMLLREFNEQPLVSAEARGGVTFVFTRAEDGSWTLLRVQGDRACVAAMGRKSDIDRSV